MMTLIAAAAVAAAQPAQAPSPPAMQGHEKMQMGKQPDQKGMDCCKDCCKDMAAKQDGHKADHAGDGGRSN